MKTRRSIRGGDRGIRNPNDAVKELLRIFAKSDFMHDFGEGIDTRDKFTQADTQRFLEIAQRFGVGIVKSAVEAFTNVVNSNPYKLYSGEVPKEIYPISGKDSDYINEDSVMRKIGLEYSELKSAIQAHKVGKNLDTYLQDPFKKDDVVFNVGGMLLNYEITAVPLKLSTGTTANIATMFHNVTRKQKTSFALIVDAAGGLSLTSLRNSAIAPVTPLDGDSKFEFFIIENIENDSDSATKIKNLDKDAGTAKNVDVFFLRDIPDSVVYPAFADGKDALQGENLFGNAKLVLSRSGDETVANFIYSETESYAIENVSQNANVKNASLTMLAAKLATDRGREAFMYPYIKRVGDWCQALSLLDGSREYETLNVDHVSLGKENQTTLNKLFEEGTDVALVTLDRILLAYALSLGLNVYFTSGSDISSLIYFRNKDVDMPDDVIVAKVKELQEKVNAFPDPRPTFNFKQLVTVAATITAETDDVMYIQKLRSFFANLTMMRFDLDDLLERIQTADEKLDDIKKETPDGPEKNKKLYSAYMDILGLETNYNTNVAHNERLLSSIKAGTYPDYVLEKKTFNTLVQDRPSRTAIGDAKNIILNIRSDIVQALTLKHPDLPDGWIADMFKKTRDPPAKPAIASAFEAFVTIYSLPFTQTGGGRGDDIKATIAALTQNEVFPVTSDTYKTLVSKETRSSDVETLQKESAPIVELNTYYRDEKANPYSIVDNYIITKEDLPSFDKIFSGDNYTRLSDNMKGDLVLRYLILYCDILMSKYERLVSNDEIIVDIVNGEKITYESEVNFVEHRRLHVEANWLLDIAVGVKKSSEKSSDFVAAQKAASQNRINVEKLDNETLRAYTDRGNKGYGIRNNKFKKTFYVIARTRDLLINIYNKRYIPSVDMAVDATVDTDIDMDTDTGVVADDVSPRKPKRKADSQPTEEMDDTSPVVREPKRGKRTIGGRRRNKKNSTRRKRPL